MGRTVAFLALLFVAFSSAQEPISTDYPAGMVAADFTKGQIAEFAHQTDVLFLVFEPGTTLFPNATVLVSVNATGANVDNSPAIPIALNKPSGFVISNDDTTGFLLGQGEGGLASVVVIDISNPFNPQVSTVWNFNVTADGFAVSNDQQTLMLVDTTASVAHFYQVNFFSPNVWLGDYQSPYAISYAFFDLANNGVLWATQSATQSWMLVPDPNFSYGEVSADIPLTTDPVYPPQLEFSVLSGNTLSVPFFNTPIAVSADIYVYDITNVVNGVPVSKNNTVCAPGAIAIELSPVDNQLALILTPTDVQVAEFHLTGDNQYLGGFDYSEYGTGEVVLVSPSENTLWILGTNLIGFSTKDIVSTDLPDLSQCPWTPDWECSNNNPNGWFYQFPQADFTGASGPILQFRGTADPAFQVIIENLDGSVETTFVAAAGDIVEVSNPWYPQNLSVSGNVWIAFQQANGTACSLQRSVNFVNPFNRQVTGVTLVYYTPTSNVTATFLESDGESVSITVTSSVSSDCSTTASYTTTDFSTLLSGANESILASGQSFQYQGAATACPSSSQGLNARVLQVLFSDGTSSTIDISPCGDPTYFNPPQLVASYDYLGGLVCDALQLNGCILGQGSYNTVDACGLNSSTSFPGWAIAVIVVLGFLCIVFTIIIIVVLVKKRQNQPREEPAPKQAPPKKDESESESESSISTNSESESASEKGGKPTAGQGAAPEKPGKESSEESSLSESGSKSGSGSGSGSESNSDEK